MAFLFLSSGAGSTCLVHPANCQLDSIVKYLSQDSFNKNSDLSFIKSFQTFLRLVNLYSFLVDFQIVFLRCYSDPYVHARYDQHFDILKISDTLLNFTSWLSKIIVRLFYVFVLNSIFGDPLPASVLL